MSKQHVPTSRNYLQNAINRINDLIPLAELGLNHQENNFYHPDQTKDSRESIGMAKRFIEYTEKNLDVVNNHNRLVEALKVLQELVMLKDLKDTQGKTENYLERQPLLWEKARQSIELLIEQKS